MSQLTREYFDEKVSNLASKKDLQALEGRMVQRLEEHHTSLTEAISKIILEEKFKAFDDRVAHLADRLNRLEEKAAH